MRPDAQRGRFEGLSTMNIISMRKQGGVALLEALIAVVLLAIGLLGTVGMQARSYAAISDAGMRAEATIAADRLVGIMNNDFPHIDEYAITKANNGTPGAALAPWLKDTQAAIPGAGVDVVVTPGATQAQVDITITWARRKGDEPNRHAVTAYIMNPKL